MPSPAAAALKQQIEAQLAARIPGALSPLARQQAERQPLQDARLTELLGGGVPVGAITEIHGEACSGRTSVAFSLAAAVTAAERVVAWVDVSDEMDPETAALSGINLERLLWVRCSKPPQKDRTPPQKDRTPPRKDRTPPRKDRTPPLTKPEMSRGQNATGNARSSGAALQRIHAAPASSAEPLPPTVNDAPRPVGGGSGSPHPLSEGRGMAEAIDALLHRLPHYAAIPDRRANKQIGTPGMPNRDVSQAPQQWISHHTATVIERASHFPNGRPQDKPDVQLTRPGNGASSLVPPDEIVPTHGSLFGRQLQRKADRAPDQASSNKPAFRRPPMPFPNASPYREEQIPTDRQPSRRAQLPGATEQRPHRTSGVLHTPVLPSRSFVNEDFWTPVDWAPLDQALRSVDLLLQAGGFSLLILDLSSVPASQVWRIPLATWFRFRAACERSRGSLVVLSQHPCARASADLTVALRRTALHAEGDCVLTGSSIDVTLQQQRRGAEVTARQEYRSAEQSKVVSFRKPVRSDHHGCLADSLWKAGTHWSVRG